ncbi:MAG: sugar phosphate isomerase/epimerase [Bryobacteraceae bacterium]|nr:sugar phosphate isomerase/epimerase [Bryobacteraceae bacterium]
MKISLGTWSFSFGPYADDPIPWEKTIERAAAAGYDGVEICGFSPHIALEDYPTSESRRPVVARLRDLSLEVSGYSADFTTVTPAAEENKQKYLDLFRRNLDLCVDLDAPLIRVDSGTAPGWLTQREYEEAFERLAEVWREAAEAAEQANVLMGWEFEPGFVFNKPSEIVLLHDKVAHPNFKVLFDTAHAYTCSVAGPRQQGKHETLKGGISDLLKMLEGRIGHVHLVDSDGTLYGDETSTHRPLGEGQIDWATFGPRLAQTAPVSWWCVDLCFCANSWDLVEPSLEFVKRMLAPTGQASAQSRR